MAERSKSQGTISSFFIAAGLIGCVQAWRYTDDGDATKAVVLAIFACTAIICGTLSLVLNDLLGPDE